MLALQFLFLWWNWDVELCLTLDALRGGGGGGLQLTPPPSIFLALNLCSLTDCPKLWHNCSLFVNTSFDTNKVTHAVCWLRNLNFSLETYWILTTSQSIRPISWISTGKCCFAVNWGTKVNIWTKSEKFENPRWRPPVTSCIWLLLPWKPIRHHVVSLNWEYKWSLLYVPNFKSIGWIVSKIEGGDPIDSPPPPPLKASCNYFFWKASRVKNKTLPWKTPKPNFVALLSYWLGWLSHLFLKFEFCSTFRKPERAKTLFTGLVYAKD